MGKKPTVKSSAYNRKFPRTPQDLQFPCTTSQLLLKAKYKANVLTSGVHTKRLDNSISVEPVSVYSGMHRRGWSKLWERSADYSIWKETDRGEESKGDTQHKNRHGVQRCAMCPEKICIKPVFPVWRSVPASSDCTSRKARCNQSSRHKLADDDLSDYIRQIIYIMKDIILYLF